jgi:hypothetical protein
MLPICTRLPTQHNVCYRTAARLSRGIANDLSAFARVTYRQGTHNAYFRPSSRPASTGSSWASSASTSMFSGCAGRAGFCEARGARGAANVGSTTLTPTCTAGACGAGCTMRSEPSERCSSAHCAGRASPLVAALVAALACNSTYRPALLVNRSRASRMALRSASGVRRIMGESVRAASATSAVGSTPCTIACSAVVIRPFCIVVRLRPILAPLNGCQSISYHATSTE